MPSSTGGWPTPSGPRYSPIAPPSSWSGALQLTKALFWPILLPVLQNEGLGLLHAFDWVALAFVLDRDGAAVMVRFHYGEHTGEVVLRSLAILIEGRDLHVIYSRARRHS